MGKISNFAILFSTLCILTVLVITTSTVKLTKLHEERLIYSMKSNIEYYAKRCYLEEKCKGDVTLNTLYENQYLKEMHHPVTKEILNKEMKIQFVNNKVEIDWE